MNSEERVITKQNTVWYKNSGAERALLIFGILLCLTTAGYGQNSMGISGTIDWEKMEIDATVTLNLASAGIRIPTGRAQAEEIIFMNYPNLIQPVLMTIPLDSSVTIGDMVNQGEINLRELGAIAQAARKIPPALSPDMTAMTASFKIALATVSARFIRHSRAMEINRPLMPPPAPAYTGIIIIADDTLPIHGRNSKSFVNPCLFPRVWDTDMNLIFERNVLDPQRGLEIPMVRYVPTEAIFRPTPSGLDQDLTDLVGSNPLRIIARGVFGISPTDPIIDREDALQILATEGNRRLLREGRVALVLNSRSLHVPVKVEPVQE